MVQIFLLYAASGKARCLCWLKFDTFRNCAHRRGHGASLCRCVVFINASKWQLVGSQFTCDITCVRVSERYTERGEIFFLYFIQCVQICMKQGSLRSSFSQVTCVCICETDGKKRACTSVWACVCVQCVCVERERDVWSKAPCALASHRSPDKSWHLRCDAPVTRSFFQNSHTRTNTHTRVCEVVCHDACVRDRKTATESKIDKERLIDVFFISS